MVVWNLYSVENKLMFAVFSYLLILNKLMRHELWKPETIIINISHNWIKPIRWNLLAYLDEMLSCDFNQNYSCLLQLIIIVSGISITKSVILKSNFQLYRTLND